MTALNQLKVALQQIRPRMVGYGADVSSQDAELFEFTEEGTHLADAVQARRNEFICARRCARAALAEVGQGAVAVPADMNGLPIWPTGFVGSISHSRGLCCAVAAADFTLSTIGLDVEKTNRLSSRAMERVVHSVERQSIGDDQMLGSLFFSAKEAFYKAQFPLFGAQLNFHDLILKVELESQELSILDLSSQLPERLRWAARDMRFRYQYFGDSVVSLCWIDRV
jgi:4'-phosphopantetheinyl transferase EntD